jgi:hypothetical protein
VASGPNAFPDATRGPNPAATHPQYDAMIGQWQACRDCYNGERTVKARGDAYLPKLDSHATDEGAYKAYVQRAVYFNATGRSVKGLVGAIHQKAPTFKTPTKSDESYLEDITLGGESLQMLAQRTTKENINIGRYGILTDYPTDPLAKQQPYLATYKAEDIVNWRVELLSGQKTLTMVVLREQLETHDASDQFTTVFVEQYRVLELVDAGTPNAVYEVGLWRRVKDDALGRERWVEQERTRPVRRKLPLREIPFVFVGPLDTEPDVSESPVQDLVDLNLAHYRTMADLKHGLHYTALPTPWVSGAFADSSTPLRIGSSTAWVLPQGAQAGMLQVSGGFEGLRTDERELRQMMASVGARLLETAVTEGPPETAFAVGMRHSGEHATLRTVAQAVEQALTKALRWFFWWLGTAETPDEVNAGVELNKDFFAQQMTGTDAVSWMTMVQNGNLSMKTAYFNLERGGVTRPGVTVEQEMKDIQDEKVADAALNQELFPDLMAANAANGNGGPPPADQTAELTPPPPPVRTKTVTTKRDAKGNLKLKVRG